MKELNSSTSKRIFASNGPAATILIRVLVGTVFLSEGIQKFLYPADLGAGRFEKIGIPAPEVMGPLVGSFELVCGFLVLFGIGTRLAVIPLICIMLVAISTTKIPILLGEAFLGFEPRELKRYGFFSMMHEARTDFSMLLGSLFLLIMGSGPLSVDAKLVRRSPGVS